MTIVKTEPQHRGEFLVSEANGTLSREVGTLSSGNVAKDGRVVKLVAGELVPATGSNASGVSDEAIVGIVLGDHDATAADLKGVVYIGRLAEVKASAVTLHGVSGGGAAAATTAVTNALKALNIVLR
ncbi:head decoration protein [Bradyrhizobium liaoningense]|uniref:head decoration protein n=1 Tax=Bradyrhizobium liaoningense TaxID=43992 RepID=UPI001BAD5DD8|nr:head decoration protein [Bradyrhizobium liaoningense]MBR0876887.1 head decoration protein [Bradyrhizobium liaoningense]